MGDEREPRARRLHNVLNDILAKLYAEDSVTERHGRAMVDRDHVAEFVRSLQSERLEAMESQALSDADHCAANDAFDAHDPSGNGPNAWTMLRSAGLTVVRVRS